MLAGVLSTPAALMPLAATVLAQAPPGTGAGSAPAPQRGEEFGKTSPIALVVILLLLVATVLLIRSMNRQLGKVPPSFDPDEHGPDTTADGREGPGGPDGSHGGAGSGPGSAPDGSAGPGGRERSSGRRGARDTPDG